MKDSLVNQKVIHGIQKLHQGAGLELARDNVAKAYMGQWGSTETIEKLRRRIHWIARQAYGNRVLDVGTSEGILPILLGREGFEVVGIDINGEAIDYANKLLEHEDPAVRERVRFFQSSLYQDQPTPHFDTVILGEVIEHITAVDRFISRALEHLKDEGRLIVTTPFGVFPDPDHKTTFYLSDLVELLRPHGSLDHLSVDDGYIRVVLKKTIPAMTASSETEALLRMTESAAHDHTVRLYRQQDDRDRRLQDMAGRLEVNQQTLTDTMTALDTQKNQYRQLEGHYQKLESRYQQLEKHLSENEETIRARDEALRRMSGIEAERETLRSALEQAHTDRNQAERALNVRLTAAETELHLLREQKVTDQHRRDQAELTAKELESELDRLRSSLESDRAVFTHEKKSLHNRIEATEAESSELRSKVETMLPAHDRDGNLFWVSAVTDLVAALSPRVKNSKVADLCTTIAKSNFEDDPLRTLVLSAVAYQLDPKPYRRKWLGFLLSKNNLKQYSYELLRELKDEVNFSDSEKRAFSKIESSARKRAETKRTSTRIADSSIRAISILDEFSEQCLASEMQLFRLSRTNFTKQISSSTSDMIFAESAWRGNDKAWEYAFTSPGLKHKNAQELISALQTAKEKGLLRVFWNKEDPLHFDKFLPIARYFDIIFTTDENCIDIYKKALNNNNIFTLPFAAQPRIHNPADRFRTSADSLCFAGSYFAENHGHRRQQMDALLPLITKFDGTIFDRMSEENNHRYSFPQQYEKHTRPRVSFNEMSKIYKRYKAFLNVNTITDSPTMMSRRVYEILASGTPIISAPSRAIEENFSDIVLTASTAKEAEPKVGQLLSDESYWNRISHLGYRRVMTRHTYQNRLRDMAASLNGAGFSMPVRQGNNLVSLVTTTCRPQMIERLARSITCQSYSNLESIIITQNFSADDISRLENTIKRKNKGNIKRIKLLPIDDKRTLGIRLNTAIQESRGDYIAKLDDDDYYLKNYISDMIIPFSFTGAAIVGKKEVFMWFSQSEKLVLRFPNNRHRHTDFVSGPTMVFKRSLFDTVTFEDRNRGEDSSFVQNAIEKGFKVYSTDPYNFIYYRGPNKNHTWQFDEEEMISKSLVVGNTLEGSMAEI